MRYLILILFLAGCTGDDWQETRKTNIELVKSSCANSGGALTITYEVSTFSSALNISCAYPAKLDPTLDLHQ